MKQKLLLILAMVWEPIRRIIAGEEPAIVGAAITVLVNLLAHYNLHLTVTQTTWLNTVLLAGLGWLVRQQVVPQSKLPNIVTELTSLWYQRSTPQPVMAPQPLIFHSGSPNVGATAPDLIVHSVVATDATVAAEEPPKPKKRSSAKKSKRT